MEITREQQQQASEQKMRIAFTTGLELLTSDATLIPSSKAEGIADLKSILLQLVRGQLLISQLAVEKENIPLPPDDSKEDGKDTGKAADANGGGSHK